MKRILQNSFGKTILCLLIALMTGGIAWAQTREEVYKTATFNGNYSTNVTNYTTTWSHTTDGFTVSLANFRNCSWFIIYIPWSYVACGGTNSPATITTAAPIDVPVTKVDINLSRANNVGSIVLQTSSDYVHWDNAGTFGTGTGIKEVSIPENKRSSHLFYRIVVNCTGNGEDNVRITQVRYYREVPDPNAVATPVISGDQPFDESTNVSITCATSGATIQYSTDGGNTWQDYTAPFTLEETTTVMAKATKSGQPDSQVASKTFSHRDDVHDVTWNLRQTPTGSSSDTQVTWTTTTTGEYFAVMSLSKSTSTTNANNYLGGTNNHTRFYQNQILRIAPLEGYTIVYVEVETTNSQYNAGLTSWGNVDSRTTDGTKVKVTPTDGTLPISVVVSQETRVYSVNVEYSPIFPPEITIAEDAVSATSAGKEGNIEVAYERIDMMSAVEVLVADENHEQADENFWLTAELDDDYNLTYTIAPNTTTEARTAYIAVHVGEDLYSNVVTVTQAAPIIVTIGQLGYSTLYYGTLNLIVPEGVEAYTYKPGNGKMQISKMYAHQGVIPADDAVVLKGEPGTYAFVEKNGEFTKDGDNLLRGYDVDHETEGGTYYYALSTVGGKNLGFHWLSANGAAFTSAAHKAYLPLDVTFANLVASGEGEAKSYVALPDEDDPTGIEEFKFEENSNDAIYNLSGQRMGKMQKGINIVNGKKIMVK